MLNAMNLNFPSIRWVVMIKNVILVLSNGLMYDQ